MSLQNFIKFIIFSNLLMFVGCTPKTTSSSTEVSDKAALHEDPDGYYSCPMHPQVHDHKAGSCPICGMPLVKVKQPAVKEKTTTVKTDSIEVTDQQQKYANISKIKIEKKDLTWTLPVSGRLMSSREIAFQVYESDLSQLKIGLEFKGTMSSVPSQILLGKIISIDQMVDPSSRTVRVLGQLAKGSFINIIESSFQGEIFNTIKNQIVVPEEAVLRGGTQDLVYVFTTETALSPRKVQLGLKSKEGYQILSGLEADEIISTGPNFLLDSESKIRSQ